jgi:hypothetical protein
MFQGLEVCLGINLAKPEILGRTFHELAHTIPISRRNVGVVDDSKSSIESSQSSFGGVEGVTSTEINPTPSELHDLTIPNSQQQSRPTNPLTINLIDILRQHLLHLYSLSLRCLLFVIYYR